MLLKKEAPKFQHLDLLSPVKMYWQPAILPPSVSLLAACLAGKETWHLLPTTPAALYPGASWAF